MAVLGERIACAKIFVTTGMSSPISLNCWEQLSKYVGLIDYERYMNRP